MISVLGTAIGVALTFVINGMVGRHNKEQAQRLTAIMVIHDIDNTIDFLKTWKEQEEEGQKLLSYAQDHKDQKEPIPADTLMKVVDLLVRSYSDYHFDTSKEKIFNSDVDIWQNLGNMKFIDNVQEIFYERQSLLETANTAEWFSKPIPKEEYMQIIMGEWRDEEEFYAHMWSFIREKMQEKRVAYYINVSNSRVSSLSESIEKFTRLNNENKFIMGITDRELDDYVNSISNKGIALTRAQLPGRWLFETKSQKLQYEFHPDNAYTITNYVSSEFTKTRYWSGVIVIRLLYGGNWTCQGDSLVLSLDSGTMDVQMDPSGIEVKENGQDSLDSWMNRYREYLNDYFQEGLTKQGDRKAYKARLDSSRDKMEWTDATGEIRYLKRLSE